MSDERFRDMAIRYTNAEDGFLSYLQGRGMTDQQAQTISALYLKEKIVRFGIDGQWRITHGAFLDQDVLERAATA